MATLTIRNLDDAVRDYLRLQAASHGRSMEAEVRAIIEQAVKRRQTKPGQIARRIHKRFADLGGSGDLPLPKSEPLPAPISFDE